MEGKDVALLLFGFAPGAHNQTSGKSPVGQVSVEENMLVSEERTKELLAIDEVLTRLQERDARIEEIGNCRFFGGPLWCRPSPSHFRRPWQCAWDAVQWWLSKELKPLNHPQEVPADGAVAI